MRKSLNIAQNSALICLCLGINTLETMFLSILALPIPGAKIGLSNLVVLYCIGKKQFALSWGLALVRPMVSALLFSNPVGFLFSICGGILSVFAMQLATPLLTRNFTFLSIGVLGSITFQFGQTLAAFVLYGSAILYYTPVLLFFGTISGALIGFLQNLLFARLSKTATFHE